MNYTGATEGFHIVGILSEHWETPEFNLRPSGYALGEDEGNFSQEFEIQSIQNEYVKRFKLFKFKLLSSVYRHMSRNDGPRPSKNKS